ncbi:MAG TPA: O-antigen ligase family protein [Gemmatimonadales bacterium]|nr:O-antigen ligase family protein [Gemmatimonadales bacterium]
MRSSRRLLQAAAPFIVLIAMPGPVFELDRYLVPKELILHLGAFGAALLALRHARRLPLAMVDLPLIGFGLLSVISAALATNPWLALRATGVTFAGLALFWTTRAIARAGYSRPLLAMLAFATVLGAATGLLQAYGVEIPFASPRRAPGGMFGNRNFMAHLTAIGLPLLAFITIESRSRAAPILGPIGIAVSAAALLLSRSRAAWLAVAAGLAIFFIEGIVVSGLWRDARIRRRLAAASATGAAGIALALAIPNTLDWRSDTPYLETLVGVANYREGSGRGRLIQYENSLRMTRDHPLFGVGPGNWPVEYPRYTTPGDPAFDAGDPIPTNPWPSSDWVAMLSERGIPATLLFLAAGIAMAVVGWRRSRKEGRTTEGLSGLAMIATIVVAGVVGTFDAVLLLAAPSFLVWTIVGSLHPAPRELGAVGRPGAHRAIGILAAALGVVFAAYSAAQIASIALAGAGASTARLRWASAIDPGSFRLQILLAQRARSCREARRHAGRAHALVPNHTEPRRILRRCGQRVEPVERAR